MSPARALAAASAAGLFACSDPPVPAPTTPAPTALEQRIERVERGLFDGAPVAGRAGWTIPERLIHHDTPGVSVAVFEDFELSWARAYGVADRRTGRLVDTGTIFQAASISKPVNAVAAMILVDRGALSLDAPIVEALRSWALPENDLTARTPVTLRALLSHTAGTSVSGFPGYAPGEPLPALAQILDGQPPANTPPIRVLVPPGSRARYSGGGTTIVQQALIDVSGQPYPTLTRELVLDPLGMVDSDFAQPLPPARAADAAAAHSDDPDFGGESHVYPELAAAGLWATPSDLARFAAAIQRALRGDADALIGQQIAAQMVAPVLRDKALGWSVQERRGEPWFGHTGANRGFRCALVAHRDDGYGAVVMSNADSGGALNREILRAIAREYGWAGYLPPPISPIALPPEQLDRLAGRYRVGPDRVVTLTREGGHLMHREVGRDEPIPLYPVSADTFRYGDLYDAPVTFTDGGLQIGDEPPWPPMVDGERLPDELLADGETDAAIAAWRELPELDASRLNRLGRWLLAGGETERAIAVLSLNVERHPDSALAWDDLADARAEAGQREQAIADYERALALDPLYSSAAKALEALREQ